MNVVVGNLFPWVFINYSFWLGHNNMSSGTQSIPKFYN